MNLVAHRIDGSGSPLVLLNGGLMSIAAWDPIAMPLLGRLRVVRCDFRGQLLSPGGPHQSMDGHAEDVVRLLDAIDLGPVHLVGTSFGGLVAMLVAARAAERVKSLVILTATDRLTDEMMRQAVRLEGMARSAAAGGDGAELFRALVPTTFNPSWLESQPPGWVEQRAGVIASFPRWWFEGLAGLMAALRTLDLTEELPRISAPTLVVAAALDRTFPVEHSRAIAAAIPGAHLEVIEGKGHGLVIEAPDAVRSHLESWVDRQDRERARS